LLFTGETSFEFSQGIFNDSVSLSGDLNKVDLSQISSLAAFGISGNISGNLSLSLKHRAPNSFEPENGDFNLTVANLLFRGGTIPGVVFPLPQISDGSLRVNGEYKNGVPGFQADAECNLGKFSGKITNGQILGDLDLSIEGEEKYAGILAAISGKADIHDKKHWRITTSRDLKSISVSPKNQSR
jgi:hypothetical protein